MEDLAPHIVRKRLIIEGKQAKLPYFGDDPLDERSLKDFLIGLSKVTDMTILNGPVFNYADGYGLAGWVNWKESGAHIYAWEKDRFFSVDIYTCKEFSIDNVLIFVRGFFYDFQIVYKEV